MYWTCGQYSVFCMWVLGSNIVIGLCIMDMWSVLYVPYVGGGILYSNSTMSTGHVVSAVCSICGWWDLI